MSELNFQVRLLSDYQDNYETIIYSKKDLEKILKEIKEVFLSDCECNEGNSYSSEYDVKLIQIKHGMQLQVFCENKTWFIAKILPQYSGITIKKMKTLQKEMNAEIIEEEL